MTMLERYLFMAWQLVNTYEGFKPVMSVVFGVIAIYAVVAYVRLGPEPKRQDGGSSSPVVTWRKHKRCLGLLAGSICVLNAATMGLYLWIRSLMPEKPTEFPLGHHLALLWGLCLVCVLVLVILGLLFLRLEKKLKAA